MMQKSIHIITKVTDGKIPKARTEEIREFLESQEGNTIEIVLKKKRSIRTLSQNAYYWAGVIPIIRQGFKDLGYILTAEETHEVLKEKFIQPDMIMKGDEFLGNFRRTTTDKTKTEFAEYIAQIQQFAAEILGVYVPEPNEQLQLI